MWRIWWAPNSIPIYIQQVATLRSLFISGNCSTCFGWYFHPSAEAHTTVSTASGICHTVTAICRYRGSVGTGLSVLWVAQALHVSGGTSTHHQKRIQLYLQYLVFVTLLLLSAAIVEELEPVWVCCGWLTPPTAHSNHPKHVEQFPYINKMRNVASCWIYIGIYLRCTDP
jgi:hypothetical protein